MGGKSYTMPRDDKNSVLLRAERDRKSGQAGNIDAEKRDGSGGRKIQKRPGLLSTTVSLWTKVQSVPPRP